MRHQVVFRQALRGAAASALRSFLLAALIGAAGAWAPPAGAQVVNPEIEPNQTKEQATLSDSGGPGMAPGDSIAGVSTGSSTTAAGLASADMFLLVMAPAPLAIYRNRMTVVSATPGHTPTIRGLMQSGGVILTTDVTAFQGSIQAPPIRSLIWYGFGRAERLYVRIAGMGLTTAPYSAVLERFEVTPRALPGAVAAGQVTITTVGQTTVDTDIWLYDDQLQPIPEAGCDNAASLQSTLNMTLPVGRYYLAVSNYNLCNDQPSPHTDGFRNGNVLDFPDAILNNLPGTGANLSIMVQSDAGSVRLPLVKSEPFEVIWVRIDVTPPPQPAPPSGEGSAAPAEVVDDAPSLVTLRVQTTPGAVPPSTGLVVTADASVLGSSANLVLRDDGQAPDDAPGDGIFTAQTAAPAGLPLGPLEIPFVVRDDQGRSGAGRIRLLVREARGACCSGGQCRVVSRSACAGEQGGQFFGEASACEVEGYRLTVLGYSMEDLTSSGVRSSASDCDDCGERIPLGFPMRLFGSPCTSVGISSNGYLVLGQGPLDRPSGPPIPSLAPPNGLVCPAWTDFNPTESGLIYWRLDGAAPERRLLIQWFSLVRSGELETSTFEVVLEEATGSIELRYGNLAASARASSVAGLESLDGGLGAPVAPDMLGGYQTLRFEPVAAPRACGPVCPADIDGNGVVDPDDLSTYIGCFFEIGCPGADYNGSGTSDPDDLSDYISDFFNLTNGCPR